MKKLGKIISKSLIATSVFGASLAAAYFLTPNRVKTKIFKTTTNDEEDEGNSLLPPHFLSFVDEISEDTGITENSTGDKHYYGMKANFENFSLEFKKDDEAVLNRINVEGQLDFLMRGTKDINFNLNADLDYNNKAIPLEIGYVDQTAYFGLKDLRIKCGSTTIDELLNGDEGTEPLLYQWFVASKEEGGINFNIEQFIDEKFDSLVEGLLSGIDLSNLAGSFKLGGLDEGQTGLGLRVEETETANGWAFDITVEIRNEDEATSEIVSNDIKVTIYTNDELHLQKIDLGTISIGNFTVKGAINIDYIKDFVVTKPDDPTYDRYNANYNYVEVINYKAWLQKLANFLDEDNQKFGIDFALDLDSVSDNSSLEIGRVEGSVNADFSNLIDLSAYQYVKDEEPLERVQKNSLLDDAKESVSLGIGLDIFGQNNTLYSSLNINYLNGAGYLNLNPNGLNSVLKAKIDTETMNWFVNEMPGMLSNLMGDESSSSLTSLFSFVTDSEFVTNIKNGDYSTILDLLTSIRNDSDSISLDLDLSSLGFGENASVSVVLNAKNGENDRILNLDINEIKIGSLVLNAEIKTNDYQEITVDNTEDYDSLTFLPTVFDQVSGILNSKQAAFEIEGSILDSDNLGITLDGEGQFDYGTKFGFGSLTIDQYKYKNKGLYYSHKIAVDVDNRSNDHSINNAYFIYGDPESDNIKGKVTVQTFLDIIDLVKTFINENKDNEKFSKFIDPIVKMLGISEITEIINSKDYFKLLDNSLIKSVKKNNDQINLTIGGELLSLDSDINIVINLVNDRIDSLSLNNFVFSGKTINLSIKLKDYDISKVSPVDRTESFMNLSSIGTLLKFGINTTKNNYYHLTADIALNALSIFNVDFRIEVYIVVKDSYCKIYGIIPDAKLTTFGAFQDYGVTASKVYSEFTFETYKDDDPNKSNGIGGYFHIKTSEEHKWLSDTIKHYKTTSSNLIDSNNILTYLLQDLLLIKKSLISKLGNISLSSDKENNPGNYVNTFTSTGFKYDASNYRWDIGLNLNELTSIDALRELEISVYGDSTERLTKLVADMNIKVSLASIKLNATITLESTPASQTTWSNDIESKFNSINNVSFSSTYLNDPNKYLSK